ncbi:D-alanyl-D-alanine carboxypeptidase family protein [Lentibacillus amyloliquefaciens]|uniref:D-alanyl-D-alanine carboxypeptidase n=1 Tax=Lentibacillus amyloliquefaciens TaxID=1472767 RepID=A0A0U4DRM2_9BACI|nr:D-alanyl-D-alanine carboxypeptidase family protein [Lentibacillus amyloliquefaciens]ALX47992.1 D-alanyl-D-alanine carboxypeptidase [Lentibacillus amyloliquefaciens]
MRYTIVALVCLLIGSFLIPAAGQAVSAPDVSANNAILIEQSSGRVLYEKQADQKQSIASITKIMTAIIAIESGKLNDTVVVSNRAVNAPGSSIYLEKGEKIKLKDLVYGLMLRSGNDAAIAISEEIGGSMEGFVHLMNQKAEWIGMTNTSFDNPHGLDSDNHYSTAYDMALLMRYAMNNEQFRQVTNTANYKPDNRAYSWQNKNKLLTGMYDYSNGGKTGYTRIAGRTLVSSALKENMELIAVTLNGPDDWRDHIGMFEWGFDQFKMTTIDQKGESIYQIADTGSQVKGYLHHDITLPLKISEQNQIQSKSFILHKNPRSASDVIGKTIYFVDSVPVTESPIYSERDKSDLLSDIVSVYLRMTGFVPNG